MRCRAKIDRLYRYCYNSLFFECDKFFGDLLMGVDYVLGRKLPFSFNRRQRKVDAPVHPVNKDSQPNERWVHGAVRFMKHC